MLPSAADCRPLRATGLVCRPMAPDWLLDVGIAPEAALARLEAAINQRPRRAFGVLKTQNEYIGAIAPGPVRGLGAAPARGPRRRTGAAEAWRHADRGPLRDPATHPRSAGGVLRPLRRGRRVGIASQPPDPALSARGARDRGQRRAVTGALFYGAARRQRADLARFLETRVHGTATPLSACAITLAVDEIRQPGRESREQIEQHHRDDL